MSGALIPQQFGALSTKFGGKPVENDLAAGVQGGFGLITYKGKVWTIRHGGESRPLMRDDGDGPRNSIEVVVLRAPQVISKIYYEQGYVEGSTAAPDCFSTNGAAPDPGAVKKQHTTCAGCPKNAWGSRVTPAGKQGKACSDSKRLAVVPLNDIANEVYGGPMLLRVPAASLQDLAKFGDALKSIGYPYYAVGTRIAFDAQEAYPKFTFSAIRPLTDAEAELVLALRDGPQVARILAEGTEHTVPAAVAAEPSRPAIQFEQQLKPQPQEAQEQNKNQSTVTSQVTPTSTTMTTQAPTTAPTTMPDAEVSDKTLEALDAKLADLLPS